MPKPLITQLIKENLHWGKTHYHPQGLGNYTKLTDGEAPVREVGR